MLKSISSLDKEVKQEENLKNDQQHNGQLVAKGSKPPCSMFANIRGLSCMPPIINVLPAITYHSSSPTSMHLAISNHDDELEIRARKHREEASYVENCKSVFSIQQFDYKSHYNCTGTYSVKVFLGGVPWDMDNDDMLEAFQKFGVISIQRPGKDVRPSRLISKDLKKAGYLYLIFADSKSVNQLINACNITFDDEGSKYIYSLQSKHSRKYKDVQVIPWHKDDSAKYRDGYEPGLDSDENRIVFLGALHGMMNAKSIYEALEGVFGAIDYVILETDRFDYPMGFGRAQFATKTAYEKAIEARFIQVVSCRFKKTVRKLPKVK